MMGSATVQHRKHQTVMTDGQTNRQPFCAL